jgi:hypothetical protein
LGQLRRHYEGRFRLSVVTMIAMAVLFVAVVPCLLLSGGSTDVAVVLVLIDLPYLAFTVWMWRWEYRHSNDKLDLYDGGLVHVDRRGAVLQFPWTAIAEVRARRMDVDIHHIPIRKVYYLKVVRADGASVVLNNRFRGIAELSAHIQQEAVRGQLPAAVAALRGGRTISFDGVVVDVRGIHHRRGLIPWDDVVAIGAHAGVLATKVTIRTRRRRLAHTRWLFPSRIFPNHLLLASLAGALSSDAVR